IGRMTGPPSYVTFRLVSLTAEPCRATEERRRVVVQAYILIQTDVGRARDVAVAVRSIPGVVRGDAGTGPYDVVGLTAADSVDGLGSMIVSKVQAVPGIQRTLTCSVVHL